MPAPVFFGQRNGPWIFKVGRAGYDPGQLDAGGSSYTAKWATEKISPAGANALLHFRRITLKVRRTGSFTLKMRALVDDVRTKVYDVNGVSVDQEVTFTKAAPTVQEEQETYLDMDIDARGTHVEVEWDVVSTDVEGVFLPERLDVHARVLRESKQEGSAEAE